MTDARTSTGAPGHAPRDARLSTTPGERRLHARGRRLELLLRLATLLLALPAIVVVTVLAVRGIETFSADFFLTRPSDRLTAGGILPALLGTVWLTAGAMLLVVPLGVLAAIYLAEYARDSWLTRTIHLAVANLAAVPPIVHALFGVSAFVHFLGFGPSILAASCTLAVLNLPTVIVAAREAMLAVPRAFREACWSMGATRWQTIRHIVLPNSTSGILTGVILAVARAAGETAPIMFTGAVFYVSFLPDSVFDQTMALPLHLYNVSTHVTEVPPPLPFAVALTLIGFVLSANAAAIALRYHLRRRKRW